MDFDINKIDLDKYVYKYVSKSESKRPLESIELWAAFIDGKLFQWAGRNVFFSENMLIRKIKMSKYFEKTTRDIFYHEIMDDEYKKIYLEKFPKKAKDIVYVSGLSHEIDKQMSMFRNALYQALCDKGIIRVFKVFKYT